MRQQVHYAPVTQFTPSKASPALSAGGKYTIKRSIHNNVSFFFRFACAGYGHTPPLRLGDLVRHNLRQRGLGP